MIVHSLQIKGYVAFIHHPRNTLTPVVKLERLDKCEMFFAEEVLTAKEEEAVTADKETIEIGVDDAEGCGWTDLPTLTLEVGAVVHDK